MIIQDQNALNVIFHSILQHGYCQHKFYVGKVSGVKIHFDLVCPFKWVDVKQQYILSLAFSKTNMNSAFIFDMTKFLIYVRLDMDFRFKSR